MAKMSLIGFVILGGIAYAILGNGSGIRPPTSATPQATPTPIYGAPTAQASSSLGPPFAGTTASLSPVSNPSLSGTTQQAQRSRTPPATLCAMVKGQNVAFRARPSLDSPILDKLSEGQRVTELGREDVLDRGRQQAWVRITHPVTGGAGWVLANSVASGRPGDAQEGRAKGKPVMRQ